MANLFGKEYYIDFDKITEKCEIKVSKKSESLEINVFKYELIKMCLQRVLEDGYKDEDDDMAAFKLDDQSISFKLAFLTLIKHDIILEYDEE